MSPQASQLTEPTTRLERDEPESSPSVEPILLAGRRSATRALVAFGMTIVLVAFAARCTKVAWTDSITSDETTHFIHCLHYWMTGDDLVMWELGAPRLPHALNALPSFLMLKQAGLLQATDEASIEALVLAGLNRVLRPARMVSVAWGLALLGVVFWAVARRRGAVAGLVAATLTSMVPEVLAHSAIAGSDMPFTTAAFLALVFLARYAERPTPARWLGVALAVGLAWAMRHTALLLLPVAGLVHLVTHWRRERPVGPAAIGERLLNSTLAGLALTSVAALVLWAGDGFGTVTLEGVSERVTTLEVPRNIGPIEVANMPIPTSILSVLKQVRHQGQGHEAYFLGEVRNQGWPFYFPVAFGLKTPIGLLVLMAIAAARVRPRGAWDTIALGFLGILWLMLVRNKVNIGVRYALLTYPLVVPFVARLFEPAALRDRVWGPITMVAAIAFAWASWTCPYRYLSYFNEIGGGPAQGWLYLSDSNVDWGQDFDALSATLDRLDIREVTFDLSTLRRLDRPGRLAIVIPSKANQAPSIAPPNRRLYDSEGAYIPVYTRYVAISVSRLHGLYSQNDMSWLRTRRLVERVGDSIFLFDMDRPAERPLYETVGR